MNAHIPYTATIAKYRDLEKADPIFILCSVVKPLVFPSVNFHIYTASIRYNSVNNYFFFLCKAEILLVKRISQ